jgi:uncharacterized membrane protein YdbT with pleckstrin-like domain
MFNNFLSKYLLPKEKIILIANPHWLFLVAPFLFLILVWFLYINFICSFLGILGLNTFCFYFASFSFVFLIVVLFLDWKFDRLYLTNIRIIKERGIIGKQFMSLWLKNIEDIKCSYGIIGRIFKYGDLYIESAGHKGGMDFRRRPNPRKIKLFINIELRKTL